MVGCARRPARPVRADAAQGRVPGLLRCGLVLLALRPSASMMAHSSAPDPKRGILASTEPSPEQREAVYDDGRNVLVVAGAGSGKTRTLVARYLRLLDDGIPPRRIAAITFTKKAAREMRNRVREAIRAYLDEAGPEGADRRLWNERYTALDAARIGTIHGLCTEILRAHPAEAGIDPRFEVMDEVRSALATAEAVDAALAWAAQDQAAYRWFELLGDRALRALLDELVYMRADVSDAFAAAGDQPLAIWRTALEKGRGDALRSMLASFAWRSAREDLAAYAADDPSDTFDQRRLAALAAGTQLEHAMRAGEDSARLQEAVNAAAEAIGGVTLVATGSKAANWPGRRDDVDTLKGALRALRDLWKEYPTLTLTIGPADEALAADVVALRSIFEVAVSALNAAKREQGALDFDDLEVLTRDLLRDRKDVRTRWQNDLAAVLVDEFQDTNARQRDIVKHLAADGRRFYVGDAKQSIYRFRGADVTGMRKVREAVEESGGLYSTLEASYRSHPALVAAQNAMLAPVLGLHDDPGRPFIEPFSALKAERKAPPDGLTGPFVELHIALGTKGTSNRSQAGDGAGDGTGSGDGSVETEQLGGREREAGAIADRLVDLVEGGSIRLSDERGGSRPLGYGDIAILCRGSVSFGAFEDALARVSVPTMTVAGRGFYERPEIRDLVNALRALADPHDDVALVGLLRSPAFGVSDPGLFALCRARDAASAGGPARSLWSHLSSVRTKGWPLDGAKAGHIGDSESLKEREHNADTDAYRADRATQIVERLRALAGRATIGELLSAYLDATAYAAILRQAGEHRSVRNVEKLLDEARMSRLVGVGEFVEWVRSITMASVREGEARAVAQNMVRILSVHAAKGLEFPVVVLGDATYQGRSGGVLSVDRRLGVLPKVELEGEVAAAYTLAKFRAKERDAAEADRLLYVAFTRAKDLVLISASATRVKSGKLGRLGGWLGRLDDPLDIHAMPVSEIDPDSKDPVRLALRTRGEDSAAGVPFSGVIYPESYAPLRSAAAAEQEAPDAAHEQRTSLIGAISTRSESADADAREVRRDPPRRVWRVVPSTSRRAEAPAWVIGTLVHQAIQRWRFSENDPELRHWLGASARDLSIVDASEADDAVSKTSVLLSRFYDHPIREAIERADQRFHELPFAVPNGDSDSDSDDRMEEGRIDVLYQLNDRWTIVDFKTDVVRAGTHGIFERKLNGTSADDDEGYLNQVQRYAKALKGSLGGEAPRAMLCLLDFENSVRLLDASAAQPLASSIEP